jgi:ribonuclease HII
MKRSTDLKKLSTKTRSYFNSKITSSITTTTHSSKENLTKPVPHSDVIKKKIENITEGLSSV